MNYLFNLPIVVCKPPNGQEGRAEKCLQTAALLKVVQFSEPRSFDESGVAKVDTNKRKRHTNKHTLAHMCPNGESNSISNRLWEQLLGPHDPRGIVW